MDNSIFWMGTKGPSSIYVNCGDNTSIQVLFSVHDFTAKERNEMSFEISKNYHQADSIDPLAQSWLRENNTRDREGAWIQRVVNESGLQH